jgi:hypothetical protein
MGMTGFIHTYCIFYQKQCLQVIYPSSQVYGTQLESTVYNIPVYGSLYYYIYTVLRLPLA